MNTETFKISRPVHLKPWVVAAVALGTVIWLARREKRLPVPPPPEILPPRDLDRVDMDSWNSFPASDPPGHF